MDKAHELEVVFYMEVLEGTGGDNGIGMAKAKVIKKDCNLRFEHAQSNERDEIAKLNMALQKAIVQLSKLQEKATETLGEKEGEIFHTHKFFVQDREFQKAIEEKIINENLTAIEALKKVEKKLLKNFRSMKNDYMKERVIDFQDIIDTIMTQLRGEKLLSFDEIEEEAIIVAEELTPSEVLQLNPQFIKGIITESASEMSHSAIIVRSLQIPIVTGVKNACKRIENDALLIVNGYTKEVIVNPTKQIILSHKKHQEKTIQHVKLVTEQTTTVDGYQVKISANIFTPVEIETALQYGAEGIGLFRTETMFLRNKSIPSEEEQFQIYKKLLESFPNHSVTIRTLDIGGDKSLPYLPLPEEGNPFLGYRSIRVSLKETDVFRTQLRALLRASIYGKLKIMFPLITTIEELQNAKQILQEEKDRLRKENIEVSDEIEIGMMVETPAACLCAQFFVEDIDFFSIGTNDLIQYTLAVDRLNDRVSYLFQPLNPAVIRLIKMVTDVAKTHRKWVSICGEMARDPIALPILVGLGLNELSINVPSILTVKNQIKTFSQSALKYLVQEVQQKKTAIEIENCVNRFFT